MNRIDNLIKRSFTKLKIDLENVSAEVMANMEEEVVNFRRDIQNKAIEIVDVGALEVPHSK
ncbi:MAG: hypothetical protein PHW04_05350 [Candidatus Wallbacteria bacterium]|nr:hypothetical protein [Candidatus Wallbacteria bacterium]